MLVEVCYADEKSKEPPAWWEAKIVSKKGPYCKVHFLCGTFPDEAVEEEFVRPALPSGSSKPLPAYAKQVVPLNGEGLHAWFLENEARVAADVREKAQLLSVVVERARPQVKLIGPAKSMPTARMLLELHLKHRGEMTRIGHEREAPPLGRLARVRDRVLEHVPVLAADGDGGAFERALLRVAVELLQQRAARA